MKRTLSLWLGLVALAAVPVLAQTPAVPTGHLHGQVINPTGAPQTSGNVTAELITRAASGPGLKATTESQGVLPVDKNGEFSGDLPAGTYKLIFRQLDTPPDKQVDQVENVIITAGKTTEQNIDMSRAEYVDKLSSEEKQKLEEMRKHNSEAMKANEVIRHLNADLKTVADDMKAADGAAAQAATDLGAGASKADIEAKTQEMKTAKYTEAETLMAQDSAAKPDAAILFGRLGQAKVGLKKYDEAETTFKKCLEVDAASKKPAAEVQGLCQAGLGEVYARTNKVTEAAAAFDEAAKANPPQAAFYLKNETVIFFQINNGDAQIAAADKAIALDPSNALLYYLKGNGLVQKTAEDPATHKLVAPPGCLEAYQKYLQLAPTGPYAQEVKGILAGFNQPITTTYTADKKKK
jgi:tetratricopeptide (TPR) repeat protein